MHTRGVDCVLPCLDATRSSPSTLPLGDRWCCSSCCCLRHCCR
jgi:hypothetical protein